MKTLSKKELEPFAKKYGFSYQTVNNMLEGKTPMPQFLKNAIAQLTGTYVKDIATTAKYSQEQEKIIKEYNVKQSMLKVAYKGLIEDKATFKNEAPGPNKITLAATIDKNTKLYHQLQKEVAHLAHEATKY